METLQSIGQKKVKNALIEKLGQLPLPTEKLYTYGAKKSIGNLHKLLFDLIPEFVQSAQLQSAVGMLYYNQEKEKEKQK